MQLSKILAEIDVEISRLEQARDLLSGESDGSTKSTRKSKATVEVGSDGLKKKKKRNLSPEGRKRIAEAVKRRWALQKEAGK